MIKPEDLEIVKTVASIKSSYPQSVQDIIEHLKNRESLFLRICAETDNDLLLRRSQGSYLELRRLREIFESAPEQLEEIAKKEYQNKIMSSVTDMI